MTNFECLEDRLVVKPIQKTEEEKTAAGIITDMRKREALEGEVISIGQGYIARDTGVFVATVLNPGDIVLYGKSAGMVIDIPDSEGKLIEHILMREGDVLCRIKKGGE